ncbi:unnamed protein product [Triticum turgidum subsp. durum]|uniref:Protein kinase domain-containing protein n=1 Tax=Triticum turgidum subsp. durum TaxID=4567 RepID=A0A9R1ADZ0_TRITD|nr:unnamed protein product [Triticum turgidum subsp. durum]
MASLELPKELPYDFLKDITDNFSEERKISADPFGTLYKGIIPHDGKLIAVKQLKHNAPLAADKILRTEVQTIMELKHENIVHLVGFCSETNRKLVQFNHRYIEADITESLLCYEYLPTGSLQENLFGKNKGDTLAEHVIDWDTRFKIVKGICRGLHFLHNLDCPIIHMDLKPENIWLDENFVPKIVNFSLCRIFGEDQTRLYTQTVVGSYGHMSPEYVYRGEISAKTDVYSLGVMMIEIITGEKNCPEANQLCGIAYIDTISKRWNTEHILFMYSSLDADDLQRVKACLDIGLRCVKINPGKRPSINEVIRYLRQVVFRTGYKYERKNPPVPLRNEI